MGTCKSIIRINTRVGHKPINFTTLHCKIEALGNNVLYVKFTDEISFETMEFPPLSQLDKLCKELGIDILGVYYDFDSGLVGTIELYCGDSEIEYCKPDELLDDLLEEVVDLGIDDKELNNLK